MRDGVVNGIKKTREAYGNIPIMVTGHSMGGAMASFCALDLVVSIEFCLNKIFNFELLYEVLSFEIIVYEVICSVKHYKLNRVEQVTSFRG